MTLSTPTSELTRNCECAEEMRSACNPALYKQHVGKRYCVLHYPGKEKRKEFQRVLEEKLKTKDTILLACFFQTLFSSKVPWAASRFLRVLTAADLPLPKLAFNSKAASSTKNDMDICILRVCFAREAW